ncbi:hypothetical protein BC831DRAFT_512640 [Entophlyctis helioformis]|nr:hypothetical protein BC831DRAFT_512640 [Entophlyctis helioformis]
MSWKGFSKAVARLPHQLAKTAGYTTADTKDEEYDHYEASFKQLDTLARSLAGDARRFKDSLTLMLAHQTTVAQAFVDVFAVMGEEVGKRLVVAPTSDFIIILDQVKKVMVKRSHKLVDYDRHRESVQKLRERTDRTTSDEKRLGTYENNLALATREYNAVNNMLKQDLPALLTMRINFIDPCLLTFFTYQHKVFQAIYSRVHAVASRNFDLHTSASAGYDAQSSALTEMLSVLAIPKRGYLHSQGNSIDGGSPERQQPGMPAGGGPNASQGYAAASSPEKSGMHGASSSYAAPNSNPFAQSAAAGPSAGLYPAAGVAVTPMGASYTPPPPYGSAVAGPSGSGAGPSGAGASSSRYVIALYDFQAQAEGDLSFKRDDKIEVIERTNDINDWWIGRCHGQTGQFPANYVADA